MPLVTTAKAKNGYDGPGHALGHDRDRGSEEHVGPDGPCEASRAAAPAAAEPDVDEHAVERRTPPSPRRAAGPSRSVR